MVSPTDSSADLIYATRLSSVGPGRVTGQDVVYEPSNADLATKLHYVRAVYFFPSEAFEGMTVRHLKETSFTWLSYYYEVNGRFRRSESTGRPYVKCNDCGVRFVEGKSAKTLEEWVSIARGDGGSGNDSSAVRVLVPNQVLGPELTFSPQVFLQLTFFKCGGVSLAFSLAHVAGDPFSACEFFNGWSRALAGNRPTHSPNLNKSKPNADPPASPKSTLGGLLPLSLKTVDPVGDHWLVPAANSSAKMDTLSFHLTPSKLRRVQAGFAPARVGTFEAVCALVWKAVARARKASDGVEPKKVTVVRKGEAKHDVKDKLGNNQVVSVVETDVGVGSADLKELAVMVRDEAVDERDKISEFVGKEDGTVDVVLYGANLTFVDLDGVDWYGFELKGRKPSLVSCFIDGVGEEGLVLVMPGPKGGDDDHAEGEVVEEEGKGEGRLVTVIVPEHLTVTVKQELASEWCFGV